MSIVSGNCALCEHFTAKGFDCSNRQTCRPLYGVCAMGVTKRDDLQSSGMLRLPFGCALFQHRDGVVVN